jgi:hypothetical protein
MASLRLLVNIRYLSVRNQSSIRHTFTGRLIERHRLKHHLFVINTINSCFSHYSHSNENMAESEQQKAQTAKISDDTIFGKITRGEIPTKFIYEDNQVFIH